MPARSRGHAQSKSMLCGRGEGTGPASVVPVTGLMAHGRQQLHSRASTPADGTLSHVPPRAATGPRCARAVLSPYCALQEVCGAHVLCISDHGAIPSQAARTRRHARICEGAHTTTPERPLPTREQYSSPADVVACSRPTKRPRTRRPARGVRQGPQCSTSSVWGLGEVLGSAKER